MQFFTVLIFLSLSGFAYADGCNPGGTQLEINQCAQQEFERSDQQLNVTYQALIKKMQHDPRYVERLREAQRQWIKYRDAELDAMFVCAEENVRICWGSMFDLLYSNAKSDLTRERTHRLQGYIDHGPNLSME